MIATKTDRAAMVSNWKRAAPPADDAVSKPPARALNLRTVMDLGNTIFFTFRGRAYGVPPLAWRAGEALLDAWLEATSFGVVVDRANIRGYYGAVRRLEKLIWKACRPVGPFRRMLRFFRLHANPFRGANESELAELAVFLLARRTTRPGIRILEPEAGI